MLSSRKGRSQLGPALGSPCRSFLPMFFRVATATNSSGIEFLDFLQPTIATFYMAESTDAGYVCQIVNWSSCILSKRSCELTTWLGPWRWHLICTKFSMIIAEGILCVLGYRFEPCLPKWLFCVSQVSVCPLVWLIFFFTAIPEQKFKNCLFDEIKVLIHGRNLR